jgi:hypothetical protein
MSRWRINVTRGTRFIGEKGSATSEVVQFTKIVKLRFSEKGPLSHNLKISTRT